MSMSMNKNSLIHEIKKTIRNKGYLFPNNTIIELDRYEEYIPTKLVAMFVKKDVLYITTYTKEYGDEIDKVSDFHTDFVKDFYNYVIKK